MSSKAIIAPAPVIATAPTSVDSIEIVDNSPLEPGTYLTAWKQTGDDWQLTVDYFEHEGRWAVYGQMGDDTSPVTVSKMTDILAAHEDAQGIADHLNVAHPLTPILQDNARRKDVFVGALSRMALREEH